VEKSGVRGGDTVTQEPHPSIEGKIDAWLGEEGAFGAKKLSSAKALRGLAALKGEPM